MDNHLGGVMRSLVELYRKYPDLLGDKDLDRRLVPELVNWAEAKGKESAVWAHPRPAQVASSLHYDYRGLSIVQEFFDRAHPEVSKADIRAFMEPICDASYDQGVKKATRMLAQGYRREYILQHDT